MDACRWGFGNDLGFMLDVLKKENDSRKLGLAACACVRRVWSIFRDSRLKSAVATVEDFADFRVSKLHIKALRNTLPAIIEDARERAIQDKAAVPDWAWDPDHADWWVRFGAAWPADRHVELVEFLLKPSRVDVGTLITVIDIVRQLVTLYRLRDELEERGGICEILRDIFDNPFHPIPFSSSWRTDTAVCLARTMYDSRDFSAMPILADALQDAGCDNEDILTHCRDPKQVHVRGCWVVDLVLEK